MKPNLQLYCFQVENVNSTYTQMHCTLMTQLLLSVKQKIAQAKKVLSVVVSLVRIYFICVQEINEFHCGPLWAMKRKSIPPGLQLSFNIVSLFAKGKIVIVNQVLIQANCESKRFIGP